MEGVQLFMSVSRKADLWQNYSLLAGFWQLGINTIKFYCPRFHFQGCAMIQYQLSGYHSEKASNLSILASNFLCQKYVEREVMSQAGQAGRRYREAGESSQWVRKQEGRGSGRCQFQNLCRKHSFACCNVVQCNVVDNLNSSKIK